MMAWLSQILLTVKSGRYKIQTQLSIEIKDFAIAPEPVR